MNGWPLIETMLFAQMNRFDGLRDRFSGTRSQFGLDDALTAVGAILAFAVVLYFVSRWHSRHSGRQSYNSPNQMFRELCNAHNLDRKTRKLLKKVARWQRLNQPARLFLEPERFEPVNLSPELERHSTHLFEIREKLFAFEVHPESRDSILHGVAEQEHAQASDEFSAIVPGLQPSPRTEAVGAAAFASTRLEDEVESTYPLP